MRRVFKNGAAQEQFREGTQEESARALPDTTATRHQLTQNYFIGIVGTGKQPSAHSVPSARHRDWPADGENHCRGAWGNHSCRQLCGAGLRLHLQFARKTQRIYKTPREEHAQRVEPKSEEG